MSINKEIAEKMEKMKDTSDFIDRTLQTLLGLHNKLHRVMEAAGNGNEEGLQMLNSLFHDSEKQNEIKEDINKIKEVNEELSEIIHSGKKEESEIIHSEKKNVH